MKSKCISLLLALHLCLLLFSQKKERLPVIFDTDIGPDYDDVGAIAMLHAYADSGYFQILGTIASTNYEGVGGVLSVFNTYFNRPNLPVGLPKKGLSLRDSQHWSDTILQNYPHQFKNNSEVPDATQVYRQLLASAKDNSVTIITVGFLTNLASLLQSPPDKYSKLAGEELVRRKVKLLVSMAGKFPEGWEFNVERDAVASAYTFSNWPTEIILSGFEIGEKIRTGLPLINNQNIQNSPVKDVFRIAIPLSKGDAYGRMSWDETAVLVAAKGYQPFYSLNKGKMIIEKSGTNRWSNEGTQHGYLVEKLSPMIVQDIINKAMMHQPTSATGKPLAR